MGTKEFNSFMDNYIDDVRNKKPEPFLTDKKKQEPEEVPEGVNSNSVYVIRKPKTFLEKVKEFFTATDEEDFQEKEKQEKEASAEDEQEFEQEYDEISKEEKQGFWSRVFSFFTGNVNEAYEDIDEEHLEEKKVEEKLVTSEDIEKMPEKEPEVEDKSIWQKILAFFGLGIPEEYEDEQQQEEAKEDPGMEKYIELKEDFKEIAVIATSAFKRLPKEQFKMFKESTDFDKFKKILKKHNIIKEKGES
jgi:hypothetical protein